MSNIEEIAKSVQSNGIFKKENWLSLSDEKKARKIVLSIKPKKVEKSSCGMPGAEVTVSCVCVAISIPPMPESCPGSPKDPRT